jgi:transcriptional regulator with XRE-family HTH domain
MTVGKALKIIRQRRELSRYELCRLMGYDNEESGVRRIGKVERDEQSPTFRTLERHLRACDSNLTELAEVFNW